MTKSKNEPSKVMLRGTVAWISYLFIVMVILFMPQVSDQQFLKAFFPLPLANGTVSYYQFVIFFGWIIGIPIATWWFLISPISHVAHQQRGFRRN